MITDREMEIAILEAIMKNEELERKLLEDMAGRRKEYGENIGRGRGRLEQENNLQRTDYTNR